MSNREPQDAIFLMTRAITWLEAAALRGHTQAQAYVGLCCLRKYDAIDDPHEKEVLLAKAYKWLERPAKQDDSYAQCNLGYAYVLKYMTVSDPHRERRLSKRKVSNCLKHLQNKEMLLPKEI